MIKRIFLISFLISFSCYASYIPDRSPEAEAERYKAIYEQLIKSKLKDSHYYYNQNCKIKVDLMPAGHGAILLDVFISDATDYCSDVRDAAYKVGDFPLSKNKVVNDKLRSFTLFFHSGRK